MTLNPTLMKTNSVTAKAVQPLTLLDKIHVHADKAKSLARLVITDFSKAFDLVDHNVAIPKLLSMGVRSAIIPWICSFLSQRSQCVRYRDTLSVWKELKGGVPQGTLTGPATFLGAVNDAALNSDNDKLSLKYVDDLTLIENTFVNKCSTIQKDMDSFGDWAVQNNMRLNPSKCMSMEINFSKNPTTAPPLKLCGQDLQCTNVVNILGVKISNNLKWDIHVGDMIKRASGRLFLLTTLKRFGLSTQDLITIFIGYVRPLLEYAVPVWHPGLTQQQHVMLERVQKRACRIILGYKYTSYHEALLTCKIQELRPRRDHICLMFTKSLMRSGEFHNWLPNNITGYPIKEWFKQDVHYVTPTNYLSQK
jgi:hypothetical protein